MIGKLSDDVLNDEMAVALARIIAAANRRAGEMGVDANQSMITIARRFSGTETVWRVNYGPKDYLNRRGGDLVIELDPKDATVKNVLRGQ
jgi:hypothetical protein